MAYSQRRQEPKHRHLQLDFVSAFLHLLLFSAIELFLFLIGSWSTRDYHGALEAFCFWPALLRSSFHTNSSWLDWTPRDNWRNCHRWYLCLWIPRELQMRTYVDLLRTIIFCMHLQWTLFSLAKATKRPKSDLKLSYFSIWAPLPHA